MKELFQKIVNALTRGENVVLCSILASSGSAPRGAGAKMAVFPDGSTIGTIGGGAVERIAAGQAVQAHKTGASYCQAFCLAPNQVRDIGMICGGNVTVYFQFFDCKKEADVQLAKTILALLEGERDAWLVSRMEHGEITAMGTYDEENGLRFADIDEAMILPWLSSSAYYEKGEPAYYVEPINRAGRVLIFGGGHVGKALAPELSRVGFRVTVFDNREDFAKPENYPAAEEVIFGDYYHIEEKLRISQRDFVCIMTPGHQADREVLLQAMRSPAAYVGCIGSRHKIAATNRYLVENGIPEEALSRIHAPIGLTIFAETPEEIAVSIAAELIRCRAELAGTRKARET